MDHHPCTICGIPATFCVRCKSAAYCSLECQQTDWETHRLLCKKFGDKADANFDDRPSKSHRLVIYFPMESNFPTGPKQYTSPKRPKLCWVDTKPVQSERGQHFHADLDKLLRIAGHERYIGRGLNRVRGNVLRGRETNKDAIDIWCLDPGVDIPGLIGNKSLHSFPSPLADTWGEKIWMGPIVVTMLEGNEFDPPLVKDVDLVAYRDALDFLGYYRDGHASMIDGAGKEGHLAKQVLKDRSGKMMGWCLNCTADQTAWGEAAAVPVAVPRAHPLLIHADDPLQIPDLLGFEWVVTSYPKGSRERVLAPSELENRLARLLLTRITVEDGKWTKCWDYWKDPAIGTILLVERNRGEIREKALMAVCRLIEEKVLPLMTEKRASLSGAEEEVVGVVRREGQKLLEKIEVDEMDVDNVSMPLT